MSSFTPYLLNASKLGLFCASGDLINQKIILKQEKLDILRTLRVSSWGFFFAGPVLYRWFLTLERLFPGQGIHSVLPKVALDQICFSPMMISSFFAWVGITGGSSVSDVHKKIKSDLWPTLKMNWVVWPTAQAINFGLIPVNQRVAFVGGVSVIWNALLSYMEGRSSYSQKIEQN